MATQKEQETINKLAATFEEHAANESVRMTQIEGKLDKLAEAVVSIARAEEKIAVLIEDTQEIKAAVIDNNKRIHSLELTTASNTSDLQTLGKFFWIIATAAITVCAAAITMALGITH